MELPEVNDLTIWYKYTRAMTFVKKSYPHFRQSIHEKANLFMNGKAQIHVVPFYFHTTGIYYQPVFDFDKCNFKTEILDFIKQILTDAKGLNEYNIFVELSPHGIHVGSEYAFGPLAYDDVRTIRNYVRKNIKQKFPHLDVISSIRFMAISRSPSMLKGKRMFAMDVRHFKETSIQKLRAKQDSLKKISFSYFNEQVDSYLFIKGLKILDESPKYILKALMEKSNETI